jgi:hypothetical protein
MVDPYRELLNELPLNEVESAAIKASQLRDSTDPSSPFYEEVVDLARIAQEVCDEKRKAALQQGG